MKILVLYAGLGGESNIWDDKEHDITHIEIDPKLCDILRKRKPNRTIICGDAHEYLLRNHHKYNFVWSSPSCPTHSRMMKATRHDVRAYPDMSLYQEIIFLEHFFKGKYVVENVKPYYEPLIKPTAILGRHYFWANFEISYFESKSPKGFITSGSSKESVQALKDLYGIQYEGNIYHRGNHCPAQVLRNCVPPKLGLHILNESKRDELL